MISDRYIVINDAILIMYLVCIYPGHACPYYIGKVSPYSHTNIPALLTRKNRSLRKVRKGIKTAVLMHGGARTSPVTPV